MKNLNSQKDGLGIQCTAGPVHQGMIHPDVLPCTRCRRYSCWRVFHNTGSSWYRLINCWVLLFVKAAMLSSSCDDNDLYNYGPVEAFPTWIRETRVQLCCLDTRHVIRQWGLIGCFATTSCRDRTLLSFVARQLVEHWIELLLSYDIWSNLLHSTSCFQEVAPYNIDLKWPDVDPMIKDQH